MDILQHIETFDELKFTHKYFIILFESHKSED